ncbi:MAG: anion permease [Candidatus Bathyarchaeota archaeon]|nr:anion permease [Candidatus Bathyarchaeota archaeon]
MPQLEETYGVRISSSTETLECGVIEEMDIILLAGLGLAFYVAWGMGSTDGTMAPLAGSGFVSVNMAALLGSIMTFLGALFMGERVEKTIGKNLLVGIVTETDILIIVFSIATWLMVASYWRWPISATHSSIGASIGLGVIKWGVGGVAWENMSGVVVAWIASPLIGFIGAAVFTKVLKRFLRSRVTGLRQQMKMARISAFFLLFWVSLSSFSGGANDVANATAFLSALPEYNSFLVRAFAGIGMIVGLLILGRKVIRSVGLNLVELNPITGLAMQISVALTMFAGTWIGLPLSGTHVLVGAVTGLGLAEGVWINTKGLKEILYTWVATFLGAASVSIATYLILASL